MRKIISLDLKYITLYHPHVYTCDLCSDSFKTVQVETYPIPAVVTKHDAKLFKAIDNIYIFASC